MASVAPAGVEVVPRRLAVGVGVRAGVGAAAAAAVWLGFAGEVAARRTAVEGIASSTWTGITAIAGVVAGADAVSGSFRPLPILGGLALLMLVAVAVSVPGAALLVWLLGAEPSTAGAMAVGVAVWFGAQIVLVNLAVNGFQDPNTLYDAVPPWSWFGAAGAAGAGFGLVAARALRRGAAGGRR